MLEITNLLVAPGSKTPISAEVARFCPMLSGDTQKCVQRDGRRLRKLSRRERRRFLRAESEQKAKRIRTKGRIIRVFLKLSKADQFDILCMALDLREQRRASRAGSQELAQEE